MEVIHVDFKKYVKTNGKGNVPKKHNIGPFAPDKTWDVIVKVLGTSKPSEMADVIRGLCLDLDAGKVKFVSTIDTSDLKGTN